MPKDESLMGKLVQVKIVESTKFSMKGELLTNEPIQVPNANSKSKKAQPVMETSFQGSFFYTLSMTMLVIACLVRLYHIFSAKVETASGAAPGGKRAA